MKYDSVVFYSSFYEAICDFPEENQLAIFKAIIGYGLTGDIPNLSGIEKAVFSMAKPQIDANIRRRENGRKGAEFGKLGGAPKGNQNARKQPQNNPKTTPNVNANVNANANDSSVTDKINDKRRDVFTPPTKSDVESYISKKGYIVNPVRFFTHYSQKGWKGVSDWKAKIDEWQIDDKRKESQKSTAQPQIKKEQIAQIIIIDGEDYVEQYGIRIKLPIDYKPQPDIDYYWDEMWKDWRKS